MVKVFFQGSFDILNVCHIKCFEDFASGDHYLIVGLNTDDLIRKYKKRDPIMPYKERQIMLRSLRWVNKVIPCNSFSCMEQLKKMKPDIFVLGEEWVDTHQDEIDFVESYGGKIKLTKFYKQYLHSTDIRNRIRSTN